MKRYEKATGIILKKLRSKERDQTFVVFTKEFGKLIFTAKGAQKITSKRVSTLDTLNAVSINFYEHNSYYFIKEIDLLSTMQSVKDDYDKRSALLIIAEIVDKLLPLNQKEEAIFALMAKSLKKIQISDCDKPFMTKLIEELLALFGYSVNTMDLNLADESSVERVFATIAERPLVSWQLK